MVWVVGTTYGRKFRCAKAFQSFFDRVGRLLDLPTFRPCLRTEVRKLGRTYLKGGNLKER